MASATVETVLRFKTHLLNRERTNNSPIYDPKLRSSLVNLLRT